MLKICPQFGLFSADDNLQLSQSENNYRYLNEIPSERIHLYLIGSFTRHFFLVNFSDASITNRRIVLYLLLFSIFMLSKHGTRKTADASASKKVVNSSRLKIKRVDGRGAVLFGMKVFWRLLCISFAMFTFNAMVKSMRLRKLQRPLMDIGEDRRRYSDKCQPLQKDARQKVHRLRRLTQIKLE